MQTYLYIVEAVEPFTLTKISVLSSGGDQSFVALLFTLCRPAFTLWRFWGLLHSQKVLG